MNDLSVRGYQRLQYFRVNMLATHRSGEDLSGLFHSVAAEDRLEVVWLLKLRIANSLAGDFVALETYYTTMLKRWCELMSSAEEENRE